ncbi:MAG: STAS domain-containing protein [Verrucomicrobiota bacterium]
MDVHRIAIVGGSGSGKTWLAGRLLEEFGDSAERIWLDDFYRDVSHLPAGDRVRTHFGRPDAIDWPLFQRCLTAVRTVLGPETIIEDGSNVENGAEIAGSVVGPRTYVGAFTELRDSFAWGDVLLGLGTGPLTAVPAAFPRENCGPGPGRREDSVRRCDPSGGDRPRRIREPAPCGRQRGWHVSNRSPQIDLHPSPAFSTLNHSNDADTAMNLHFQDTTLALSGITELKGANSVTLRDEARSALRTGHTTIDVDLSETRFVDSSGLGALIALHKTMCARGGKVRIINPMPTVQQILELTRLHRVFEIVKTT